MKYLILILCFFSIKALSYNLGYLKMGVKTPDKKYFLPNCGELLFSKTTSIQICDLNRFDFFKLPDGVNYVNTLYADEYATFAYSNEHFIFAENKLNDKNLNDFEERFKPLDKVNVSILDIRTPLQDSLNSSYEIQIPYSKCWQAIAISANKFALICATNTHIDYVELSSKYKAFKSFPLLTAIDAGVTNAQKVIPNFILNENKNSLDVNQVSEYLGNDAKTFPKGYFDIKSKKFIKN